MGGILCTGPSVLIGQEGVEERRAVRGLRFLGNEAIEDLTLRNSIATTASSCWIFGIGCAIGFGDKRWFDEREFRRDVLRIRALYIQSGFRQVQVDTLVRRTADAVRIEFRIFEGEPVRVTRLEINGIADIITPDALKRRIPLREGGPFNRFQLQQAADTIRVALQDRGYPYAQVFRNFDEDREALEAEVFFEADPGPRATVREVLVAGNDAVEDEAIRRLIPVRDGRLYRRAEMLESQRDLYGSDLFGYVDVSLTDSAPPPEEMDSLVTVRVQVSEASLHRIRLGAGYGSIDCFRGLAGWTARNFLGGARRLDLTGRVSKVGLGTPVDLGLERSLCFGIPNNEDPERLKPNYTLSAALREPVFFSRRTSATISFTAERRSEISAFVRTGVAADIAVQRPFAGVPVTLTYAISLGRTEAEPAIFCGFLNVCREADTRVFRERIIQSTLGVRAVRDHRDSPLNPTTGSIASLEARWASGVIGSDSLARFTRLVGELASYHPLGAGTVLSWRVRAGAILPPAFDATAQSLEFVPPDERFYAGGPNTVRGFGQNRLGPVVYVLPELVLDTGGTSEPDIPDTTMAVDTLISPTGGNQVVVANLELRFPLPGLGGNLSGALFVDVGQVFSEGESLADLGALRITPGFGTRFATPLGPIRVDIAYNPYDPRTDAPAFRPDANDVLNEVEGFQPSLPTGFLSRLQFHFSIGQAF